MGDKPKQKQCEGPKRPSTIGVVPFYPNLKLGIQTIPACLIFTYLEIHHPAPQDTSGRPSSLPVTVTVDQVLDDLQVARRTLALGLYAISVLYRSEAKRWSAARGAREFIQSRHSQYGSAKLYSIVAQHHLPSADIFVLRRNLPAVVKLLDLCGLQSLSGSNSQDYAATHPFQAHTSLAKDQIKCKDLDGTRASVGPLTANLAEIMLKASVLAQDRRSVRYPRLRKAVAEGLEDRSVLRAKQPKRLVNLRKGNDGVEPELPEEVRARLNNLREDEKQGI